MTRKYGKKKQKGFQPKFAALILGGILVLGAAFLVFRGNNENRGQLPGGTPSISADQNVIDFGNLKDFTVKNISIQVTNTGTGRLDLAGQPYIQVVKGCCPPALTAGRMSLDPGQSTTITSADFFMHPGMDGKHDFAVHIKTNDPAQPDLVVHVLSNWSQ